MVFTVLRLNTVLWRKWQYLCIFTDFFTLIFDCFVASWGFTPHTPTEALPWTPLGGVRHPSRVPLTKFWLCPWIKWWVNSNRANAIIWEHQSTWEAVVWVDITETTKEDTRTAAEVRSNGVVTRSAIMSTSRVVLILVNVTVTQLTCTKHLTLVNVTITQLTCMKQSLSSTGEQYRMFNSCLRVGIHLPF